MPHDRPGPLLAETRATPHPPRSRRRGRAALFAVILLVAGAGWFGSRFLYKSVVTPRCTITAGGMSESFDPEQTGNAALISAIAVKRELPPRAATIALTTAYQESKIRNLRFGDRDSLGLFQQRPSQGWGTAAQILDPIHATNAFYDALKKFNGYETADITEIAQKVQRSGYPQAYRDHEGQGRVLASALTGQSPAGLTCRLDEATSHANPRAVASDLLAQMGVAAQSPASGDTDLVVRAVDQTTAWAVGQWAVARADQYGATRVSVGQRAWDRGSGDEGWSAGTASQTVTITLG